MPSFVLLNQNTTLIRKKNPERKIIKKFTFKRRLETPVIRLSYKNKI